MKIGEAPPFDLQPDPDGTQHAIKDHIQISILPDAGPAKVNHRKGERPSEGKATRWLHVALEDHGLHIFVHGTHVVVTAKDYSPTFARNDGPSLLAEAFKHLKAEKDERGCYVVDTPGNRRILAKLIDLAGEAEGNRLQTQLRHAMSTIIARED